MEDSAGLYTKIKQKIINFAKRDDSVSNVYSKKNILIMYHNYHTPSEDHIKRLSQIAVDFDIVVADSESVAKQAARYTEIILGNRYLLKCLPYAKNLRWVQTTSGGVDQLPINELRKRNILLSRTTLSSKDVARHAHTLAWSLIRRFPLFFSHQHQRKWFQIKDADFLPFPQRALIIGFGNIGKEIAKLLKNDGLEVWAAKRMQDEISERLCDRLFDECSWRDILPQVDLCFLALPLNRDTKGLIDESALRALPTHAVIINVSRGEVLDETALFKLLKERRLGGAGLDVLSKIPTGYNEPIWDVPNLIITPHVAAHYPERNRLAERFFECQISRYLKNEEIENIFDYDGG